MQQLPDVVHNAFRNGLTVALAFGRERPAPGQGERSMLFKRFLKRQLDRAGVRVLVIPARAGFALAAAEVALKMRLPVVLVMHDRLDTSRWSPEDAYALDMIRDRARAIVHFSGNSFQLNAFLTQAASTLLATFEESWDGDDRMLVHVMRYAEQQDLPVENLWPDWQRLWHQRELTAQHSPVRLVNEMEAGDGLRIDIDRGPLANPFGTRGKARYARYLEEQLADQGSDLRKVLGKAWVAAKNGTRVFLVSAAGEEAVHGRILLRFLVSHLASASR